MLLETSRPDYSRLDDYFGLWSIYEPAFNGLFDLVARTDLSQHIAGRVEVTAESADDGTIRLTPDARLKSKSSGNAAPYHITKDGVAIIPIRGSLMKAQSSMSTSTSTVEARGWVRQAKSDPNVVAALFVFDTPGGTVAGTQSLAEDIKAFGLVKPTAGYCDDLTASAGYWLASQCQFLACGPTTLVGSIGTFMAVSDLSAKAADMKVKVHVIKAGEFKGAGVAGTPITEEQLAQWQRMVTSLNEQFVTDALMTGRKMTREQATALADGRVHVGSEAKALGLVDAVQSLDETISQLVERARSSGNGSSKGKDTKMANEDTAPKAATLAELKAACVGASSDFLMAQLEANATVAVAQNNYIIAMRADTEKLRKENEQSKAAAEAATKEAAKAKEGLETVAKTLPAGGVEGNGDKVPDAGGKKSVVGSGAGPFNEAVKAAMDGGLSRSDAVMQVAREQPDLHQAFLIATNPRSMKSKIEGKYAEEEE